MAIVWKSKGNLYHDDKEAMAEGRRGTAQHQKAPV